MVGYRLYYRGNGDLLQEDTPCLPELLLSVPLIPQHATVDLGLCQRPPNTHRQVWLSLRWGQLLLSPGSWCAHDFVRALQESVSLVLCKFCNQILLTFKVTFPEDSQSLCWIPMLGSLLWGLELSQQCENSFGIIVLQYGSPTQQLYDGTNGDLLQEDLCYMPHLPRLLLPEPLSQKQATADPCLSNTHREGWFILLWGAQSQVGSLLLSLGPDATRLCLCPPSVTSGDEV